MFNLIMRWFDWADNNAAMPMERMFEFTDDNIRNRFNENGTPSLDRLMEFPCLFMNEGIGDEICRVGTIARARISNGEIRYEYTLDADVPPLRNGDIYANRNSLDMPRDFEFSRNHWALKEVDLYRFLLRNVRPRRQRPTVFQISEHENVELQLVSAMMPFNPKYDEVYKSIQLAALNSGLRCRRADDIWENPAVMQDVVSLIDRSRIVICDCYERNPNVFYEAGIAHTLGREVILITQDERDIPFDLRHLRYVPYIDNAEGRAALTATLQRRMEAILGH